MVPDNYALGAIVWRVQVRIHMVPDNYALGAIVWRVQVRIHKDRVL